MNLQPVHNFPNLTEFFQNHMSPARVLNNESKLIIENDKVKTADVIYFKAFFKHQYHTLQAIHVHDSNVITIAPVLTPGEAPLKDQQLLRPLAEQFMDKMLFILMSKETKSFICEMDPEKHPQAKDRHMMRLTFTVNIPDTDSPEKTTDDPTWCQR